MNYLDIVDNFSYRSGRTKTESKEICDQMLTLIMDALKADEPINVYGFCVLEPYTTPAGQKKCVDGVIREVKQKRRVKFRLSRAFLGKLNGEEEYGE